MFQGQTVQLPGRIHWDLLSMRFHAPKTLISLCFFFQRKKVIIPSPSLHTEVKSKNYLKPRCDSAMGWWTNQRLWDHQTAGSQPGSTFHHHRGRALGVFFILQWVAGAQSPWRGEEVNWREGFWEDHPRTDVTVGNNHGLIVFVP